MVQVLKKSTAFILSFVISNSSKHMTRGLPSPDALVYRAATLIYDIRVKYFRTPEKNQLDSKSFKFKKKFENEYYIIVKLKVVFRYKKILPTTELKIISLTL